MKTTVYIDMSIKSNIANISDLTEILKLSPQYYHNIGDKNKFGEKLDYSQWDYYSNILDVFYTSELTTEFSKILEPKIDVLKKYINKNKCVVIFYIVISCLGENPSLDLCPNFIRIMSELNASFSFDNVYLS